jgi:hypothetical protein
VLAKFVPIAGAFGCEVSALCSLLAGLNGLSLAAVLLGVLLLLLLPKLNRKAALLDEFETGEGGVGLDPKENDVD